MTQTYTLICILTFDKESVGDDASNGDPTKEGEDGGGGHGEVGDGQHPLETTDPGRGQTAMLQVKA